MKRYEKYKFFCTLIKAKRMILFENYYESILFIKYRYFYIFLIIYINQI